MTNLTKIQPLEVEEIERVSGGWSIWDWVRRAWTDPNGNTFPGE